MSNDKIALVGQIIDETDPRDVRIEQLEREARVLRRQLSDAETQTKRAREDADRAMSMLRRQLSPLYRALQAIFGELDAAGVTEAAAPGPAAAVAAATGANPRTTAIWESWKQRLGPACGDVIDALLLHPGLNTTQLGIAIGKNRNAIPNLIYRLNQAGLINKNGGKFSLKEV